MNSKMVFGQYYYSDSWVHHLDPRTKILAVIIYMIAIFLIDSFYVLLGFFIFTVVVLLTTKIPITKFLRSIRMLSFLLFFTFIFQILFRREGDLLYQAKFTLTLYNLFITIGLLLLYIFSKKIIKKFRFTLFLAIFICSMVLQYYFVSGQKIVSYDIFMYTESLVSAGFLVLRLISVIFTSSLLTLSTKPTELNSGLEKLLKPINIFSNHAASILSMMISIALRNIPTLINEANKILKAQASRGVDFKEANFRERIAQIISLIVPMFIIAYKKAEDLSDAMEARGYNPSASRTTIHVLNFRAVDIVVFIFLGVMMTGLIIAKIFFGV